MIEFNLNDYCWVQLTDLGRKKLKRQHDELNKEHNGFFGEYKLDEDSEGWSHWQMHEIMNKLGHMLINGVDVPFMPTIRLDV